jgi:5-methylcytosine-specific restriction enzyme subunit McrC
MLVMQMSIQNIHLLDIYFEWYLNEVQLLIHQGLSNIIRKRIMSLKGKLVCRTYKKSNHKDVLYHTSGIEKTI